MVPCVDKNRFSVTEGHLEDVCPIDMWLQRQMYERSHSVRVGMKRKKKKKRKADSVIKERQNGTYIFPLFINYKGRRTLKSENGNLR